MRPDIADTSRNGLRWGAVCVCQMGDAILDDHGRVAVGSRSVDAIGQAGLGDVIGHQRDACDTLCAQKHCKRTGMDVMSIGDQFGEEFRMRQNTSDGAGITMGEWPHRVEGVRDLACPRPDGFEHLLECRVGVPD